MNSHVIAVDVCGHFFWLGGIEGKANHAFKLGEKRISGPAVLEEEKLEASLFAALAEYVASAENFCDAGRHRDNLVTSYKCCEAGSWKGRRQCAEKIRPLADRRVRALLP